MKELVRTPIPIARPQLGTEEEQAVLEVMRSGLLTQGRKVHEFEERFAAAVGSRYGVATSSGSTALFLALLAHGIGKGDEVITSPLTFIASANSITHTGATPVFADVDDSLNLDPDAVRRLIGPATRAIMPVHLHGNPCDMAAFRDLADEHGLALIQDACQAVGATLNGKPLGNFGTACYSFYATKNITTGEGGMVVTDDQAVAAACAGFRHQGYRVGAPYIHDFAAYNFRMTEMQAAIGLVQLDRLDGITESRREIASYYDRAVPAKHFLRPRVTRGARHVYHQYVLRVRPSLGLSREEVRTRLEAEGVGAAVHYPVPVHRQPAYADLETPACPLAEKAAADMISIPVHPQVSLRDREHVAETLNAL